MSRFTSPVAAGIATAALAATVAGGVAFAQTGSGGVVNACVQTESGTVRILSSTADCRANETFLSWNQQGQPGPQGEQGPQGVPGPAGSSGDNVYFATGIGAGSLDEGGTTLVSLDLPAGLYRLEASVQIGATTSRGVIVECTMPGNSTYAEAQGHVPDGDSVPLRDTAELVSAIRHTGGAVALRCEAANTWTPGRVQAVNPTLMATKVATLNGTP